MSIQFSMPQASPIKYEWSRLWLARGKALSVDSDGFVRNAADENLWSRMMPNETVPFDEIRAMPCLILLGEPGLGKSHALEDAFTLSRRDDASTGYLKVNLGEFPSEDRLFKTIFESVQFTAWKDSGTPLRLFLDSFDECLIRIDSLSSLLAEAFGGISQVRDFHLRIASRPTEWPVLLENTLRKKWGEAELTVCELVPLTRAQIAAAVVQNGIDAPTFLNEVTRLEVVPFASKPLTLELLIRIWKDQGQLPQTQGEIYEKGCLLLCGETNPARQSPKLRPKLTPAKRMNVASRIAAASLFGKKPLIYLGASPEAPSPEFLALTDLEGSDSFGTISATSVDIDMFRESLDTGLFAARGAESLRWYHPTFADFLAVRYITDHGPSVEQLFDLLNNPCDPEMQIVPQLREVAALLAQYHPRCLKNF